MGARRTARESLPVILLPPSEGKAEGGERGTRWTPKGGTFAHLSVSRTKVVKALVDAGGGSQKLLGVGGKHLERAQHANTHLTTSPTLPAWQRYTGVVWDHLNIASLTAREKNVALGSIVVPSGLAGLVAADDPLPDYRLKMNASLAPLGKISTWWREAVSTAISAHARGRTVIDLLTNEHRSVIATRDGWHEVTFATRTGAAVGHDAKATKGVYARHVVEAIADGADTHDAMRCFTGGKFKVKIRTL